MSDHSITQAGRFALTNPLASESLTTGGQLDLADSSSYETPRRGLVAQEVLFTEQGAAYWALAEIARLQHGELPFLAEVVARIVVPRNSSGKRDATGVAVLGDAWEFEQSARISEIAIFGAQRTDGQNDGEALLGRLVHGLAHVYNHWAGISDTSNRGRYHNARFATTARRLGLGVGRRDATAGFTSTEIASEFRGRFSHIIMVLKDSLALTSPSTGDDPLASAFAGAGTPTTSPEPKSKYVFASCRCMNSRGSARTIRIASGSWQPLTIHCSICGAPFASTTDEPSVPAAGQLAVTSSPRPEITN